MNRTNNIIAISCVFVLLSFMNIMNTNRVNSIKLMNIRKSINSMYIINLIITINMIVMI